MESRWIQGIVYVLYAKLKVLNDLLKFRTPLGFPPPSTQGHAYK